MKKKIIGQKIISIQKWDEYCIATLENGMEIEISDIITMKQAEKIRKDMEKYSIELKEKTMNGKVLYL